MSQEWFRNLKAITQRKPSLLAGIDRRIDALKNQRSFPRSNLTSELRKWKWRAKRGMHPPSSPITVFLWFPRLSFVPKKVSGALQRAIHVSRSIMWRQAMKVYIGASLMFLKTCNEIIAQLRRMLTILRNSAAIFKLMKDLLNNNTNNRIGYKIRLQKLNTAIYWTHRIKQLKALRTVTLLPLFLMFCEVFS